MYSDDSPFLREVREISLAFPEAVEVEAWGRPTFRAGKKVFSMYMGTDEHPQAVAFKADPQEQRALIVDARFYVPPYWGPHGWLALDLPAAPVDWTEVAELVESSYRQVALKRMVAALDASR
jgi:predicted DNA-binding protein (MmcQ/YjbR family)